MQSWDEVAPRFAEPTIGHLATLEPDGSPNSVPVWVHREGPDHLALFSIAGQRKDRNIVRDPRVSISVTRAGDDYAPAAVRGEVVERIEGERAKAIIDRISELYTGGPYTEEGDYVAYLVRPTAWWARGYDSP